MNNYAVPMVTRRDVLSECLIIMRKLRDSFSKDRNGIRGEERYQALFDEYDLKCQILMELIQANESEPVTRALANWQKEIMNKGKAEADREIARIRAGIQN